MPGNGGINDTEIAAAVKSGRLNEDILDRTVERILRMTLQAAETLSRKKQKDNKLDVDVHHQLARKVAGEAMVLLRNEEDILPLEKKGTIAFIGAFAKNPRYQGGGSSRIQPTRIDTAYEETEKLLGGKAELCYAEGYSLKTDLTEPFYLEEAVKIASEADVAVLFIGLTDSFESESYDRTHLDIPQNHKDLLDHPVIGDIAEKIRKDMTDKFGRYDPGSAEYLMMDALVRELPLRNLVRMSGGKVLAPNNLDLLLAVLNREKAPSVLAGFSRPSSS